jgi:hypothetical protein
MVTARSIGKTTLRATLGTSSASATIIVADDVGSP